MILDIFDCIDVLMYYGCLLLFVMCDYMYKLEDVGVECIVIFCNIVYYWFKELKDVCYIDILSIVEIMINEVCVCGKIWIGLLVINVMLYMGLY